MAKKYDETAVQTLDAIAHIRLRSGMYIGRLGDGSHPDDGIYILFKEVIDNSIDEFIMNHGSEIDVNIDVASGKVSVRDYGRGIPLGKVIECVSRMNTGAKYNDEVFQFSVGLNGVGLKAVNALSEHFLVRSVREGRYFEATFEKGVEVSQKEGKSSDKPGTYVEFIADREIFKNFRYNLEMVEKRIWHYCYLNTGLKITYNGAPYQSKNGLLDLINSEVTEERLYEPLHFRSKGVEFAFLHTAHYGESYFSFVNGQYTSDGGTHLQAFRDGLVKAVCEYAKKSFQSVDIREGLLGALLVRVKDPVFESQTKNKLSNTDLKGPLTQTVKEAVLDLLYKNTEVADKIIERTAFNEKLRKELSSVRKEAKEKQKKIFLKIPKLRDCKFHLHEDVPKGEDSMIFLTEGDSAGASIVASRDPLTQAVFPLRGKPLNVFGMKLDQLYRNEEMFNLMSALNVENGIEGLRYNKVIIATDADVDGMHIRNLLITFFLTYFESLVINGHLFLLETPLFKVRHKDKSSYFYSESDKEAFIAKLPPKQVEITRFKGLGEISPNEFGQFIGEDIRLIPITVTHLADIQPTLEFYMGKNTPERKSFIMQHLVHEE
ncbi:MAG: type IIA DNA topoisomerase subunit B [Chlamydiales bacterium]|nr:type IIA DNA topoisomerase subunit B [Chlamydiales bacterium]